MMTNARVVRRAASALTVVLGVFVGSAAPVGAHPFLVRTDPADGARLARPPQAVSLQFSESLGDGTAELSIARQGAGPPALLTAARASGGRVVRADVAIGRGVYQVRWRVVADDGHLSEGEFSFAVGDVSGSLPRARVTPSPASPLRSAAGWAFFVGLALVIGAVATALTVDRDRRARQTALATGLVVASCGAAVAWLASTGGIGGPVGTARQRGLLALTVALLALATPLRRRPVAVGVLAGASAVAWSARGQVGVQNGAVGIALDSVHLLGAGVWAGALALLVFDLWRVRDDAVALAGRARRYASLVVVPVAVLAAAGVVSALLMVPAAADLWETTYGRLVVAKTILFAAAVALAWQARRRGLTAGGLPALRRLTRPEAGLLTVVLVVAAVLANTAPPPARGAAASLLGPPPLSGPVVRDAGLAGILTVAVAVGDGLLQVEVLVPGGDASKARAEIAIADGAGPAPGPLARCGDGCLSGPWQPRPGSTTIRVAASAPGWRGGSFTTTLEWPPAPEDPAMLEQVLAAMRAEPAVEMIERTSSGPDSVVTPMTYRGSGAELVDEAPYASGGADDVRPTPSGDGLRLYLPGDRLWVTMWLDDAGRIARERIVNVGLQIDHEYRYGPGRGG